MFIDDILVYSTTYEEHATYLGIVLQILRDHQLYTKRYKCDFWMAEIKFLVHMISYEGILIDLAKIDLVL